MAYEVTATRKRPHSFDNLVGQDFVVSTLRNAVSSGRIANAFLFSGPRGVGKTSAARILARALNNPKGPTVDLNKDYPGADDIAKGRSIDVIEIDGASNTSVNDVRSIKDEVLFAPQSSRFKIYIIDEVHMLSNSAFNALLKTIEEPPPYVKFIFATTEIHKVPATIRSRCQQFNFRLIPLELIKEKLVEACKELEVEADDEALFWIAREGTGSLRDAYTLFDQVAAFSNGTITLQKIREKLGFVGLEQLTDLADAAYRGDSAGAIQQLESILQLGISVEQCIIDLAEYYRGVLLLKTGITRESLLGASSERFHQETVTGYTRSQIERTLGIWLQLYRDIRYSLDARCELELALVRICGMRWSLDGQEVAERLEDLEKRYAGTHVNKPSTIEKSNTIVPTSVPVHSSSVFDKNVHVQPITQHIAEEVVTATEESHSNITPSSNVSEKEQEDFLSHLERDTPMLAGTLAQVKVWSLADGCLTLEFDSSWAAREVKEKVPALLSAAKQVWPSALSVVVTTQGKKPGTSLESTKIVESDPAIKLATDIFRGEVVMKNTEESSK